jgi:hypothetical protein
VLVVAGDGFEPPKLARLIYRLTPDNALTSNFIEI